jgi:hypothetical protein
MEYIMSGNGKTLFNEDIEPDFASTYVPLSSVWERSDSQLIEAMLSFYPTIAPEPILDATYNAGRFWEGSSRDIVSMDIDKRHKPMILGDNRVMKDVPSSNFGVVVCDPPHVGPQGRDKSVKRFDVDFGATVECGKERDWTLSYLDTLKGAAMYSLEVYYDVETPANMRGKDDEANEAAGREHVASGCFLLTMTRDLTYEFETKKEMKEAKTRLKDAGFRFEP